MKYIFDIDGTLVDSSYRHKIVFKDVLSSMGISIENTILDIYYQYKLLGKRTTDFLKEFFLLSDNEAMKITDEWIRQIELNKYLELDKLYGDTLQALSSLPNDSVIFLTARKNKQGLLKELERLQISHYASEVYVVSPGHAFDEKATVVQNILSESECMIIGDTEIEYDIAVMYAIPSIILHRGFRSREYWTNKNVKTYSSLLEGFQL